MTQKPPDEDSPSLAAEIGLGLLCGLLLGPFLLIRLGSGPDALRIMFGAWVGGASIGGLHYSTRAWPTRRPTLAPWRGVAVGAGALQIVGVFLTVLRVAPLAALPLWAVIGAGLAAWIRFVDVARGRDEWRGVTARGAGVVLLIATVLAALSGLLFWWTGSS